jgi:hypothetical protein
MIVGVTPRQFVLASAMIAVAMLFGSAQARAGYLSIPEVAEHDGRNSLAPSPLSPLADFESTTSMGGSSVATQSRSDTDSPHAPTEPIPPSRKLPFAAHNFGPGSGAGSSSNSSSSNGPSSSLVGALPGVQMPLLERAGFLPPQPGDSFPFSVASFLFRPPRAL